MIRMKNLTFAYRDGTRVFEDFNWQAQRGSSWAILGPSGCGKTTLLFLLAGLQQPNAGEILIAGDVLQRPRPRTGLILQDYGLLPWADVQENIALGLRIREFYGPDTRHAPSDEVIEDIDARITSWMERLGLQSIRSQYPAQISGGQRQRTAIARTLALNPDLLLMDEPFASLDAPARESLQDLILELQLERALTTVIVTHTIEEAALMGRKVLILSSIPNRIATVIDNPQAGEGAFRRTMEYMQVCNQLRQALERAR